MGRRAKSEEEKAVKLSISIPAVVYERLLAMSEASKHKKVSRIVSEILVRSTSPARPD
jgi:hypothetical protein